MLTTLCDLCDALLTRSVADILEKDPALAPFSFQKLGAFLVAARLLPGLEDVTEVSQINANTGFAPWKDFRKFLAQKLRDGNADGKSDCTFKCGDAAHITSAKFREGAGVDIAKDLDSLNTLRANRAEFATARWVLFVRDRDAWIAAYNRAPSRSLYPIRPEHVYDVASFESVLPTFRKIRNRYASAEAFATSYLATRKELLRLRFHQHLAILTYLRTVGSPFLYGMKCRSGKTVVAAGTILATNAQRVLFITPIPSETKNSAVNMFSRYLDFDDYAVVNLEAGTAIPSPRPTKLIVVASKQYLDRHAHELSDICFDLVFQDEIHWAGLTDRTDAMRKLLVKPQTSLIVLSGTGERARTELGIDSDHVFTWDLEDEAACKRGDISFLKDRFEAGLVDEALGRAYPTGSYDGELPATYREMPTLRQLIYTFTPQFLRAVHECLEADQYSLDLKELFRLDSGTLLYPDRVLKVLKSYLGASDGTCLTSTMDAIRKLTTRAGKVGAAHFPGGGGATQLWFLPEQPAGGTLDQLSKCLKTMLEEHFPEYAVLVINSAGRLAKREGLETYVQQHEQNAIRAKKSGLILLLGKMLAMGVSLPRADIVCMFNTLSKMELYTQQIYRCLTQDINKEEGIVVDFNQKRVLEASMSMLPRCTGTGTQIIERMVKVIAFGPTSFTTKDVTDVVAHFTALWRSRSIDRVTVLSARLGRFAGALAITSEEMRELTKASWSRPQRTLPRETASLLDPSERIPDAVSESATEVSDPADSEGGVSDELPPDIARELMVTLPPFIAFLTFHIKREAFMEELLSQVRESPTVLSIFRDQCAIWWKISLDADFIGMAIRMFARCDVQTKRAISSMIAALKSEMGSELITDMRATLAFMNSILAPKVVETKKFGEVFTPAEFADEMLNEYSPEIWSDPTQVFYDPAAGSGVFGACIYYRLMDGLRGTFPDEDARKAHILTNMLFMSELNAKNCAIIRLIFGPRVNLHVGDSLTFDPVATWGESLKRKRSVGNPPYNEELTRAGAKPLYHRFVEKDIDTSASLLFVIPSRWFGGGKGLDGFRKQMLARKDIRSIRHIENASSVFGSAVSIEGGICVLHVDRSYMGPCMYNGTPTDLSAFDILTDPKYSPLITKLATYPSLASRYRGRRYGIETNDGRLTSDSSLVPCFVSQTKGGMKYIAAAHVKEDISSWKVITARANGKAKKFGNTFVGSPNHVHTGSYISFDVASESEATNLISYMRCKLPNTLLGLRKVSQDINESTCKWIPLPPLDRIWTDEAVYAYYKLTPSEIALVM
jgi:hypothetical protein